MSATLGIKKLHLWMCAEELPASVQLGGSAAQSSTDFQRPKLSTSLDVNALSYCRFSLLPLADNALVALPKLIDSTSADVWALPSGERVHAAIGQAGKTSILNSNPNPEERSKAGIFMALHLYSIACDGSSSPELRLLCGYESGGATLRRFAQKHKVISIEGTGWEVIWDAKLHVESIMAMRVSPKNDFALTISADHIVRKYDLTILHPLTLTWDTKAEGCVAHRTKHPGNGTIAIREDGRVCAVGGWDGSIRLYATHTTKSLGTLKYHKTQCQAVEFAQDQADATEDAEEDEDEGMGSVEKAERARWLVGGGKDNRVSIWSLITFNKN
ncbi:hypothetical protein H0H81_011822 [Sphagnurus paluster]|uniref:ASTRA-associated protein 1 n=1 Tax=Sphagnurus paluster TaxID=117069 RepID=A0A9P7FQS4_9AGAR|nr:hypothetical protein H0H81_011822 [Sphagnurus paluster]